MKNKRRILNFTVALISLFGILFCSACARISAEAPTSALTAEAIPSPTATPSSVPTPTPIPTPNPEEIRISKLNQDFQDFLNKQGEFTPEKIFSQLIEFYCSTGTNNLTMQEDWSSYDKKKFGLGWASIQPDIQGYLFDYFEKEEEIILIVGFDGLDGTRFITPIEIPFHVVEVAHRHFGVIKYYVNNMDGIDYSIQRDTVTTGECSESMVISDRNALLAVLDSLKGKVITIGIEVYEWTFDLSTEPEYLADDPAARNCVIEYQKELNSKVELSFGLLHLMTNNGIDFSEWQGAAAREMKQSILNSDSSSILKIDSADRLKDIDISNVPMLGYFGWFAGTKVTP